MQLFSIEAKDASHGADGWLDVVAHSVPAAHGCEPLREVVKTRYGFGNATPATKSLHQKVGVAPCAIVVHVQAALVRVKMVERPAHNVAPLVLCRPPFFIHTEMRLFAG